MRKLVGAVILAGFAGLALPAQAADLGVRHAPVYKAAPAPMVVVNPWVGFYGGINGGGVWEKFTFNPTITTSDGFFGAQIGYNWVAANVLYGVEGDLQGTFGHVGTTGATTCGGIACTINARLKGFGTVRGRLGMLFGPSTLAYITGGLAVVDTGGMLFSGPSSAGFQEVRGVWKAGYAVGGGVEQMLWGRWSGKLEYLYLAADGPTLTAAGVTGKIEDRANIFRAGLNYHF